jgi:hypothetical protein
MINNDKQRVLLHKISIVEHIVVDGIKFNTWDTSKQAHTIRACDPTKSKWKTTTPNEDIANANGTFSPFGIKTPKRETTR